MGISTVSATVKGILPPGDSLIGVYPQILFRVDEIETRVLPDVQIIRGGRAVACDGKTHAVEYHERTLCVGCFLAIHVRNGTQMPRFFEVVLRGPAVDAPAEELQLQMLQGLFAMECGEARPEEDNQDGLELGDFDWGSVDLETLMNLNWSNTTWANVPPAVLSRVNWYDVPAERRPKGEPPALEKA